MKADNPWAIDLVGKIKAKVVDNFGLYAKAGGVYLNSELKRKNMGPAAKIGGDAFNVTYGVGLFYEFTPNIVADLSWTRYHGDADWNKKDYIPFMDLFAVSLYYKFDFL